jgi:hypothetical protein
MSTGWQPLLIFLCAVDIDGKFSIDPQGGRPALLVIFKWACESANDFPVYFCGPPVAVGSRGLCQSMTKPHSGANGSNQGIEPLWSKDGRQLYYGTSRGFTVYSVPVTQVNGTPQFGTPKSIATGSSAQQFFFYDVAPDGSKLLLPGITQQVSQPVTVVTDWTARLKK